MKKKISIFLTCIVISSSFPYSVYSKSINELNKQKGNVKNKINSSKQNLSDTKSEKNAALKDVQELDKSLEKIENELEELQKKLEDTKKSLAISQKDLEEATRKREKQYESLKKRLRVMYEYGNDRYLDILLNSKGFTDFFKRIEYVNYIIEYDDELFKRYKETEDFIALKVKQIEVEKANLEVLTKKTEAKKQEVKNKIVEKQKLMEKLSKQESALEQQIKDLEREDREITSLINQAIASQAARKNKPKAKSESNTSETKVYAGKGGKLAHPVPQFAGSPYNDVYGYRINPISKKKELHSGLDMKAKYGSDIVAAESGTVIYAGTRGGYGKTVIIDHGGGMTTLYAHNSKLVVKKGDEVKRGQVIAKAGSTGYSTGVHAHFEVRINGKHTNPAPYLK